MPDKRAKHKRHLQVWIDNDVFNAFLKEQRDRDLTRAELAEQIFAEALGVKPSGRKAARSGMASGKKRLTHGSWRLKPNQRKKP